MILKMESDLVNYTYNTVRRTEEIRHLHLRTKIGIHDGAL